MTPTQDAAASPASRAGTAAGIPAGGDLPTPGLVPPAGPDPRTWTIACPPGMELLTGNSRLSRYPRARLIKTLKGIGWALVLSNRLPRIERVDVAAEYRPPAHRHPLASAMIRDADNMAPTVKALIDGIFPQDSVKHVRRVSYEFGPKSERGQVLLHITEVTS